jgi:membrane protein
VIFLFFAQWLYVAQYFDSLLICELYLLPNKDEDKFFKSLKRALFIQPQFLLRKKDFITILNSGEYIYKKNDTSRDVYYIFSGNVQLIHSTHVYNVEKGNFIGLESAFFDEIKREDAITLSDVELIKIPQEIFISLLERNSKASKKALNQISEYFAKTYNHYKE